MKTQTPLTLTNTVQKLIFRGLLLTFLCFILPVSAYALSVSGTVYTDNGTTPIGAGKTVRLLVNGIGAQTVTTAAGGTYSFPTVTAASGAIVTLHIDNDAANKGMYVFRSNNANLAGANIYKDTLRINTLDGQDMTNSNLDTANDGDADITYFYNNGTGSTLTTNPASPVRIDVMAGAIYAPGGTITLDRGLAIDVYGNFRLLGNTLNLINSSLRTYTGGIFASGGSNIILSGTGGGIQHQATGNFDTITVSSGSPTISTGLTVINMQINNGALLRLQGSWPATLFVTNLTVNGTIDINSENITVSGTFSNNGTFALDSTSSQVITLTQDIDSGTWLYNGDGDGVQDGYSIRDFGVGRDYYNLLIDPTDNVEAYTTANTQLNILNLTQSGGRFLLGGTLTADSITVSDPASVFNAPNSTQFINAANIVLNSGTFYASSNTTNIGKPVVGGTFTKTGGTFNHNNGQVVFAASQPHTITGDFRWSILSLRESTNNATNSVVTIGGNQTFDSQFQADGLDADDRLEIRSSTPGLMRNTIFQGNSSFFGDNVIISDNTAVDSSLGVTVPINPPNSVDGGNTVNWFAAFNFSLANGGNRTVSQGATVTNTVTATLVSGTAQIVTFSTAGLPVGATATYTPTICSPTCTTTMAVATSMATPVGTYTLTVTGLGGAASQTTTFTLTVTTGAPPAPSTPDMTALTDLGPSNTDNITSDRTPDFYITCVPGSTVLIFNGSTQLRAGGCSAAGNTTITASTLPFGNLNINVQQIVNGNMSPKSANLPITIDGSYNLTWNSTGASSCSFTGFTYNGTPTTSGSVVVFPLTTTTYTISCANSSGSTSKNITITVS